jgi:hypothetical protein
MDWQKSCCDINDLGAEARASNIEFLVRKVLIKRPRRM